MGGSQDPRGDDAHVPPPGEGGEAKVLGGAGIAYQKHLAGEHEVEGWNQAEIIVKGDSITHLLNGKVINQGKNVRLVDPEKNGKFGPSRKAGSPWRSRRPRSSSATLKSDRWVIPLPQRRRKRKSETNERPYGEVTGHAVQTTCEFSVCLPPLPGTAGVPPAILLFLQVVMWISCKKVELRRVFSGVCAHHSKVALGW